MARLMQRVATTAMWVLAFTVGIFAARYLVFSAAALDRLEDEAAAALARLVGTSPQVLHIASHNRALVLIHVAAAIVALVIGPFQFSSTLRAAHLRLHRWCGYTYLTAVALGSISGLPLSFLAMRHLPPLQRTALLPTTFAFASLAAVWPLLTAMAYVRVRQRRFDDHRAWMMRSYSLTFAAVTTRLVAPIFLVLTRDPFTAVNAALLTWPLNLAVAEWLIRRSQRQPEPSPASGARAAAA